ncbi:hypothetical protein FFLO_02408 [Filobasidium floriforme]|uniref:Galactose oxidase n=1 Tax=Filobasidium floriforme TaxID=5210 RepID=A0A8K0NRA4_9TREE|nr:uncharacterized protein HD553DRAFT_64036 [Filobasidium floriforme]KAG7562126.1 hypothetical protein FFLO_02408 [Filobasidium floriforme]KAH8082692.1 hypothetical protein HD553DRAFT_64036 [Filobasidium floriforme]
MVRRICLIHLLLGVVMAAIGVHAYIPAGRWGHTLTYIPSATNPLLVLQGGRSDETAGYTYSSAPLIQETLFLPLRDNFDLASPPWQLSDKQAETVAWHTAGYLENTEGKGEGYTVSFGGDGGPTLPVQTNNDSLHLYSLGESQDVFGLNEVVAASSDQLMRRWYASSGSIDKTTWLVSGGLKGDGSGLGFRDVYQVTLDSGSSDGAVIFEPQESLPIDLAGHATLVTQDGTVWLFGGYIPSTGQFLPLDKAYSRASGTTGWTVVDLKTSPSSSSSAGPPSRRGFSLVLVSSTKAILYGGSTSVSPSSADSSSVLSDLWELDLELGQWTLLAPAGQPSSAGARKRAASDGPGERFEHAAVGVDGKMLVFGGTSPSLVQIVVL